MSLRQRLTAATRGERGSISSSIVFALFVSLVIAAIVTSVLSNASASTRLAETTELSSGASQFQTLYLAAVAQGTPHAGEACADDACSSISSVTDTEGKRTVVSKTTTRYGGPEYTRSSSYRTVGGTAVTGFDASGSPVWGSPADSVPLTFTQLASYGKHACAIAPDKSTWCWGANTDGQLGNGTTADSIEPVRVTGDHEFVRLIEGSTDSTCALDAGKKAWCWGANADGQLGTGEPLDSSLEPVEPLGGHLFTSLTASPTTTCGIDTDSASWCWGLNAGGTDDASSAEPIKPAGDRAYKAFTMSASATCALGPDDKGWCWSAGTAADALVKECEEPCTRTAHTPAPVDGDKVFASLSISSSSNPTACGLQADRTALCWGNGSAGQRGDGTKDSKRTPTAISDRSFSSLAAAADTFCGLQDGSAWCWGANDHGQTGTSTTTEVLTPAVAGSSSYTRLTSTTEGTFCGLTTDSVECWGTNTAGQAAPGTTVDVLAPKVIPGLLRPTAVTIAQGAACALDARQEGHCWGDTARGSTAASVRLLEVGRRPVTPSSYTGYVRGGH